jgi:hypothetical protein
MWWATHLASALHSTVQKAETRLAPAPHNLLPAAPRPSQALQQETDGGGHGPDTAEIKQEHASRLKVSLAKGVTSKVLLHLEMGHRQTAPGVGGSDGCRAGKEVAHFEQLGLQLG